MEYSVPHLRGSVAAPTVCVCPSSCSRMWLSASSEGSTAVGAANFCCSFSSATVRLALLTGGRNTIVR